jgi:hypothetical protein
MVNKHMCGDCCCGSDCHDHHGPRKVLTKEEKLEKLNKYKEDLKKELSVLEEAIQDLIK